MQAPFGPACAAQTSEARPAPDFVKLAPPKPLPAHPAPQSAVNGVRLHTQALASAML